MSSCSCRLEAPRRPKYTSAHSMPCASISGTQESCSGVPCFRSWWRRPSVRNCTCGKPPALDGGLVDAADEGRRLQFAHGNHDLLTRLHLRGPVDQEIAQPAPAGSITSPHRAQRGMCGRVSLFQPAPFRSPTSYLTAVDVHVVQDVAAHSTLLQCASTVASAEGGRQYRGSRHPSTAQSFSLLPDERHLARHLGRTPPLGGRRAPRSGPMRPRVRHPLDSPDPL